MFSDRFWFLKLALALGAFSLLCHGTARDIVAEHPDTGIIPTAFHRVEGKLVWPDPLPVEAPTADGFTISHPKAGPLRILTPNVPPEGEIVTVRGRIIGPRTLRAEQVQIRSGWSWKRPLNYAISILTLAVFLFMIRKRFRWAPEGGLFRSRY